MDKKRITIIAIVVALVVVIVGTIIYLNYQINKSRPDDVFNSYISYLQNGEYEQMYEVLTDEAKSEYSQDVFVSRNKNIYNGIEAENITVENLSVEENNGTAKIGYTMSMDTMAGKISFSNEINLLKDQENQYKIDWSSKMIYPDLDDTERVRVGTTTAKRGNIYDRNGVLLAGEGTVSSVGLVPGKMNENSEEDIKKLSELLEISEDRINSLLGASYVQDDTFVAITNVAKENYDLKEQLLEIPGVKITDATARVYPYGEEIAHLIGYVQNITAEELEENSDKGYTANSVIGKTGLERVYEDRLRGYDGSEIYITDSQGNRNQTIAKIDVQNGEDIKLTIDVSIQSYVYEEFKNDKSAVVIMNPKTGEILALCSTPSYDTNDFILGISSSKWESLQNDANNPLYNRYQASYAPGSSFKPVIGAIGLTTGKIDKDEDFGTSGTAWQKDSSWGTYNVTTLATYSGKANLLNALIYSDNIYFAKAALKIGSDTLSSELNRIGFNKQIDFAQAMTASTFANNSTFESEIQLADTGYGQGKVLTNPVHMASIYSAFVNNGNMIKPYIKYAETPKSEVYIQNAFSSDAANTIKEDLIQVVENPNGTAHEAQISGVTLAGKTGTAEIKESQDDETGTELGWFNAFIADENSSKQYLIISMVEDVKGRGGSHYLLPKVKSIFQKII